MDAISVVMATNRIDDFLDLAVESVLASQDVDIELVLVLDGVDLPTNPPEWSRESRVRLITREKSLGLAAALNAGISASKHPIIARLDADDISTPNRFSSQLRELNGPNRPILVGSLMTLINGNGELLGAARQACGPDIRKKLLLSNVVPHSSYMLRKSDAISIGLYREDLRQMEDYEFLLRLAIEGPISVLCESLIRYRVHPGQMSKKADWRANYIQEVIRGQYALGQQLGVPRIISFVLSGLWRLAQLSRSMGLTQPGHLVGIRSESARHRSP